MTILTWILVIIFLLPSTIFWLSFCRLIFVYAYYATQEAWFYGRILWDVRRNPEDAPYLNYIPVTIWRLIKHWSKAFLNGSTLDRVSTIGSKIIYQKQGWSYERIVP